MKCIEDQLNYLSFYSIINDMKNVKKNHLDSTQKAYLFGFGVIND